MRKFSLTMMTTLIGLLVICSCDGNKTVNVISSDKETNVVDLPVEKRLKLAKKYNDDREFSEGLAGVELNGKWGFIDKTGKQVIPCKYDGVGSFEEGLALVSLNFKRGYIDKTGKQVIPCTYDDVVFFSALDIIEAAVRDSKHNMVKYYYDKNGNFLGM